MDDGFISYAGCEFEPKRAHDLEDGAQTWVAFRGQRFIQTLTSDSGVFCQMHHAIRLAVIELVLGIEARRYPFYLAGSARI